jgi:hypothetical protein
MYATFVSMTLATLLMSPHERSPADDEIAVTVGRNAAYKSGAGKSGLLTLEFRPTAEVGAATGLKPVYGLGFSPDGTRLAFAALRKTLRVGRASVTPSFGPALYWPYGHNDGKALLQFRTGVEVHATVVGGARLGIGFYHLSNADLTPRTAAIDAFHVSLRHRF